MSSRERFLRCKLCGIPHEEGTLVCPVTGRPIEAPPARASAPALVPAPLTADTAVRPEGYRWKHSLHPEAEGEAPEPADLVGRTIDGKYRIDALLGKGGMGAVFRAENTRIGKPVAIKILVRAYERGSESERRFSREARIVGSLGHPNIVEIFDLGALEDGAPYQVMELLEGRTLAERIRREGALEVDEALDVADQVLSALGAAHQRGIVHRDLKPDNVFLATRGGVPVVKLLDFGISKNLAREDETLSLTRPGAVVGTPYYLSPEQAKGDPIDHRADIWSMGVVLYETLTGALPFQAENYNRLMMQILTTRPRPLRERRASIPEDVEAFVLRALAFDAAGRFQGAAEMRRAIRALRGRAQTASVDDVGVVLAEPDEPDDDPTEISDRFRHLDVPKSPR